MEACFSCTHQSLCLSVPLCHLFDGFVLSFFIYRMFVKKSQSRSSSLVLLFWILMILLFFCPQCFILLSMLHIIILYSLWSFFLRESMHYRMIVNEWYLPAFATLAISGASDWVSIAPLKTVKSIIILLISSVALLFEL